MRGEQHRHRVRPGEALVRAPPAVHDQRHVETQYERYRDDVPKHGDVHHQTFEPSAGNKVRNATW